MSISNSRSSFCNWGAVGIDPMIPERVFLEKALIAVTEESGLIHGSGSDGYMRCAVGAAIHKFGAMTINDKHVANALQEFNDAMPDNTPERRRELVIAWIEERLAMMPTGQLPEWKGKL